MQLDSANIEVVLRRDGAGNSLAWRLGTRNRRSGRMDANPLYAAADLPDVRGPGAGCLRRLLAGHARRGLAARLSDEGGGLYADRDGLDRYPAGARQHRLHLIDFLHFLHVKSLAHRDMIPNISPHRLDQ